MAETFSTVEVQDFSTNVMINAFIAGLLQQIWSIVSSQQLVIMMPLLAVSMPANALTVFAILLKIAAFDMIPAEKMWKKMLDELEGLSSEEKDFLQERMESSGFDTIWILPNLGSLVIFLGIYLLMIVIYLLMACLVIRCIPKIGKRT